MEPVPLFGEAVTFGVVERWPVSRLIMLFGSSSIFLPTPSSRQLPESERTRCPLTALFQVAYTVE